MRKAQAKKIEEDDEYTPPRQAWDLLKFIEATPEELAAKTVDCATCPVALLCNAAMGGTGIVCQQCKATSVWCVDEDNPEHVMVLDCNQHHFADDVRESHQQIECSLCSGTAIKFAMRGKPPFQHFIMTTHSAFGAVPRQTRLKEAHTKWVEHNERVARANANQKK